MTAPPPDHDEWEARITRGGRRTWHISPVKGMIGALGCIAFGSELHAERKAQRILARLRREDERMADTRVVR